MDTKSCKKQGPALFLMQWGHCRSCQKLRLHMVKLISEAYLRPPTIAKEFLRLIPRWKPTQEDEMKLRFKLQGQERLARTIWNNVKAPRMKMQSFKAKRARKFTRTSPRTLPICHGISCRTFCTPEIWYAASRNSVTIPTKNY